MTKPWSEITHKREAAGFVPGDGPQRGNPNYPDVQGACPACGWTGLFLGAGGFVTCSQHDCPDPTAPTNVLHPPAAVEASPAPADPPLVAQLQAKVQHYRERVTADPFALAAWLDENLETLLAEVLREAPAPDPEPPPAPEPCPRCWAAVTLPDGSTYCSTCGERGPASVPVEEDPDPDDEEKVTVPLVLPRWEAEQWASVASYRLRDGVGQKVAQACADLFAVRASGEPGA